MAIHKTLALIIICTLSIFPADGAIAQKRIICRAVVDGQNAKFIFPLPDRSEFTWYQTKTKDDYQEYTWQVSLEGTNPQFKYNFGVYLYKYLGSREETGSLKKLFSRAQFSVWEMRSRKMRLDLPIDVYVKNQNITILVSNGATFKALFANKPTVAHFMVQTPYEQVNFETSSKIEYLK